MRIAPSWQYAVVNGAAYTEFPAQLLSDRFTFENRISFSRSGIVAASWRYITQDVCSSLGAEGVRDSVEESCPSSMYQALASPPSFFNTGLMMPIVLILHNCLTEIALFRLQQGLLCVGDFLESGFVNLGIRQIERG